MSKKEKLIADLLFGLQIVGAFIVCSTQFFRMLQSIKGVVFSQFILIEVYALFQLWLAVHANRAKPSRIAKQTIVIYITWFTLLLTNVAAVFINGNYMWGNSDSWTILAVVILTLLAIWRAKSKNLTISDPMIKGVVGSSVKAIPQFVMAWKIALEGGLGVPGVAVFTSNFNILVRIGQLVMSIRQVGWDKNRRWMLVTESLNYLSWFAVTVAWALWRW